MMIPAEVQTVMGSLRRLSRSQRAFIAALAFVLIPTCLGLVYLLSDFWVSNRATEKNCEVSATRDTLLLNGYDRAIRLFSVAQEAYTFPERRDSLRPLFDGMVGSLHAVGPEYVTALSSVPEGEREPLLRTFARLWFVFDDLVRRSEVVFAGRPPSAGAQRSPLFIPEMDVYLGTMRGHLDATLRAELSQQLRIIDRFRTETELTMYRGFFIAFVLFGLGAVLAVVIVRRGRLNEERQRRYETLLEASLNPIEVVDVHGRILFVNPAFERWSGRTAGGLLGSSVFESVRTVSQAEGGHELWSQVETKLREGQAWSGEVELQKEGGEPVYTLLIISPVVDAHGRFFEAIGIHHDVTERRELARKFAESQEKYQNIVESSLDGIVIVQEGNLVFVNDSSAKIFGYGTPEQMRNVRFVDMVAPSNRFVVLEGYEGKAIGDDILRNFEMKGLTKQGAVIDLEVNAKLVSWNEKPAVQASFRDITKRKSLEREQALWLWEQETMSTIDRQLVSSVSLQAVLDAVCYHAKALTRADWAGVMMLDMEASLARWRAVTGNRAPLKTDPIRLDRALVDLVQSGKHVVMKCQGNWAELPMGQFLPFEGENMVSAVRFPLLVEKEFRGHLVVGYRQSHDFTPREIRLLTSLAEKSSIALSNAQLYDNLLSRERELEMLSGARVNAQEEERRRIAREIHDSLGQMLTAIKFNVEILEDASDLQSEEDLRRIADIKSLLDNAMAEAREISYNLMPSVLVDFGLLPALQFLGEQFSKRSKLDVKVHTRGVEERLDSSIEIGLYRIAQEALNNIAKHAEASEVNIQLIGDSHSIRLIVDDDGRGFNVNCIEPRSDRRRGMGLVSMRERAASFSGILLLDSRPGDGTEVIVEIPRATPESHG